jgi:hypothetical protein
MPQIPSLQDNSENIWKKVFLILSIAIIILMPLLSKDYGQSGDEWLETEYGQHIYNYFFNGDKQALDYTNRSLQYESMNLYGGFFNYYTELIVQAFPNMSAMAIKHFFNALMGAIMMIFTGLLAFRMSRKWSVGVIALLFIFFSPRLFGESMNNPKDIPHACGFVMGIYGLVCILQDFDRKVWLHALILALGFGITFGQRPAGGLLQVCYIIAFVALYYIFNKDFKARVLSHKAARKKVAFAVAVAFLVGYAIGLSAWPYGLESPIDHTMESLKAMTNRGVQIRVLFDGKYAYNNHMPWYYEFKWILISNPIAVIVGVGMFLLLSIVGFKRYGVHIVLAMLFAAFFPLLYMVYKKSSMHDTWRHVFFVYTFWVVIAAMGWDLLTTFISNVKYKKAVPIVAILSLVPAMVWTVRSHPNQYVYFNEFIGGPAGAYGYYDVDYYQNSGKQAADWIKKNVKPIPGKKIVVMSNLSAFYKYFEKDTAWIVSTYARYGERHHMDWDYYVTYPRYISAELMQNGMWPPPNTLHSIDIDGTPLSVIFKNKSKAGIAAFDAYEKKDYATAAELYKHFVTADASDETAFINYSVSLAYIGQMNEAVAAAKKAIELNPFAPEYYDLLAQLYGVMRDEANARAAMTKANELKYSLQEEEE